MCSIIKWVYNKKEKQTFIDEIYHENDLCNKFPRKFIFDKFINELIIQSYD